MQLAIAEKRDIQIDDFQRMADSIIKKSKEIKAANSEVKCPSCFSGRMSITDSRCVDCSRNRNLEKAGIPKKYWESSLENLTINPYNKDIISFCNENMLKGKTKPSLFLYGPCGTGKTHIAVASVRDLVDRRNVLFTTVPQLLLNIRSTFDSNSQKITEQRIINMYGSCGMLVLDDFGAEKISDWSRQIVGQIVHERDSNSRPMIITSNMSITEVSKQMDKRIASRIAGSCLIWKLNGSDYRMKQMTTVQKKGDIWKK